MEAVTEAAPPEVAQLAHDLHDLREYVQSGACRNLVAGVIVVSTTRAEHWTDRNSRADRLYDAIRSANQLQHVGGIGEQGAMMRAVGRAFAGLVLAWAGGDPLMALNRHGSATANVDSLDVDLIERRLADDLAPSVVAARRIASA